MKSSPSSQIEDKDDSEFVPLPLIPTPGMSPETGPFRRHSKPLDLLPQRKRKVAWTMQSSRTSKTPDSHGCPTPVFLQFDPSPTKRSLRSVKKDPEKSIATPSKFGMKSPLSTLTSLKREKSSDTSKFYRFSRLPPYMQFTVEKKRKSRTPQSSRPNYQEPIKQPETPKDLLNRPKRPHSIFLEIKNKQNLPEEVAAPIVLPCFNYRQADIRSLRTIKEELRFLQKLREETYDKAVDNVLDEYQLNSIMEVELTFMNKKGNVFAKYIDQDLDEKDYFDQVQRL